MLWLLYHTKNKDAWLVEGMPIFTFKLDDWLNINADFDKSPTLES